MSPNFISTPPPSLLAETGTFTISISGNGYIGFFFQGDEDFKNRCINLCINYGILQTGKVHSYGDTSFYVLTPPDRLRKGLREFFKNEVKMSGEVEKKYIKSVDGEDVVWEEEKVEVLAEERVEKFLKEKVEYKNLLEYEGGYYPNAEYRQGSICAEKE